MALENVCCEDSHCRTTEEGNCSYLLPLSQCSSTRRFNVGHSTTVTKVKRRIYFQLTRDTQYLASMCRIWGFYGILTALLCILDIVDHVIIEFVSPMNIETGNFVFTDGTVGCHSDDLQCHPWGLCWHHDECRLTQFSNVCVCVCFFRDPVIRLISDYTHVDEMGVRRLHDFMTPNRVREMETVFGPNTYPDFEWLIFGINGEVDTELQLVTNGLYAEHLKRYLRHFSMDQIHVIDGDTFGKYPWKELSLVEKFLNIDPYLSEDRFSFNAEKGFYCLKTSSGEACLGKDKGRTHPDVNPTSIEKLKQFYRPHNEELFKMLNKKFEW